MQKAKKPKNQLEEDTKLLKQRKIAIQAEISVVEITYDLGELKFVASKSLAYRKTWSIKNYKIAEHSILGLFECLYFAMFHSF